MPQDMTVMIEGSPSKSPGDFGDLAKAYGLRRVGTRPPLGTYLWQAWQRRDFMVTMALYRLRSTVEGNRLGVLWYVIRPLIDAAIYGLIFGVLQGSARPPDYIAYVVTGVFLFNFFTTSFSTGAQSIVSSNALVQSLAFPRLTLPLSRVVESFLAFLPSMTLLPFLLVAFGHRPSWQWLLMIPLLALFFLFSSGTALVMARLTVHLRDVSQLIPVISRLLFYTSGVLFDVNRIFEQYHWVIKVYNFYPLYQVLCIARGLMMGTAYPLHYWFDFSVWSVVFFIVGLLFFWSAEERYGRE